MCLQEEIQEGFFVVQTVFVVLTVFQIWRSLSLPEGIKDPSKGEFEWFVLA